MCPGSIFAEALEAKRNAPRARPSASTSSVAPSGCSRHRSGRSRRCPDPSRLFPIGWNTTSDAIVVRVYVHHGVAGMLTFWQTKNIYTEDFRSFSTGSGTGTLGGHGINHEQSSGVIRHIRPKLYVNGVYSGVEGHTSCTSLHMMLVNVYQDIPDVRIIDPTFDRGPGSAGMFCVGMYNGYRMDGLTNRAKTPPYVRRGCRDAAVASPHKRVGQEGSRPLLRSDSLVRPFLPLSRRVTTVSPSGVS